MLLFPTQLLLPTQLLDPANCFNPASSPPSTHLILNSTWWLMPERWHFNKHQCFNKRWHFIASTSTSTATLTSTTTSTVSSKHSLDKDFSDDRNLLFDDDLDDEKEELLLLATTCVSLQRKDPHFWEKLVWNNCVSKLNKDGPFAFQLS